ncbi:Ribonuclease H [Abeliophyllum distichum]|uniref:Ribonuclease H n=1 Tax=Abeliophyllum distichum TaxID=126358 RepID=A0ABD1VX60_9LAMI
MNFVHHGPRAQLLQDDALRLEERWGHVSEAGESEEGPVQLPVYYVSKAFQDAETMYPNMEKFALSLIIASRKLRPYFQSHSIEVLTNLPLRQILQKLDISARLMKWSVELSQFDISYKPRLL